jgi:hypothetical protein
MQPERTLQPVNSVGHLGLDESRAYCVDADAGLAQLDCRRFVKRITAPFDAQ